MTTEERLAALEARIAQYDSFFTFGTSVDGRIPYAMTQGRLGVMTDFWAKQPWGKGAALSVGTASDRFAVYGEIDAVSCPDHPSTAFYGSVVAPNSAQPNIAFESHAANAPAGNLPFYGDYQYAPGSPLVPTEGVRLLEVDSSSTIQRQVSISANGITLKDGAQSITGYYIQKIGSVLTWLWP